MNTDDEVEEATTRISREGQVTIPKELREAYGLEEGDKVVWEEAGDDIKVRRATRSAGRGMLVSEDVPEEKREEMAEEMEAEIREQRRTGWHSK